MPILNVSDINQTFYLTFLHGQNIQSSEVTPTKRIIHFWTNVSLHFWHKVQSKIMSGKCGCVFKVCFADRQVTGQWIYKGKRAFKNINEETVHTTHCTTQGDHESIETLGLWSTHCALGYGDVQQRCALANPSLHVLFVDRLWSFRCEFPTLCSHSFHIFNIDASIGWNQCGTVLVRCLPVW